MNSDPLAIPVKKGRCFFLLLMTLMMRSRKAALKGEYCVEGELSKSENLFIYVYVLGTFSCFVFVPMCFCKLLGLMFYA